MFPHSRFTLMTWEVFIYSCILGLGFLKGKNKTKISNMVAMKFLPLSCVEGKELGNGTPIHKRGTGPPPPSPDVGVQHPLKLFDPSTGHHQQRLSQLITQQECGSPVTFPRGTGRKATTQKREENVVHFRREIIECYCDGKHWADNGQGQRLSF